MRWVTACGEISNRVAPVREMFAHVAEIGDFYDALAASGKLQDAMELVEEHFARGIEQRLAKLSPAHSTSLSQPSRAGTRLCRGDAFDDVPVAEPRQIVFARGNG